MSLKFCIIIESKSQKTFRCCSVHQHGRRDVKWKPRIKKHMSREFSALLTNAVIVCQLVHIISIWDTNGNRMNFIWNVLNWKRDLVIQKFDFTCLVKHTLKREATSWKLNEHVIYNGTQFSPYSSLTRRASALEMVHRAADSTSVIKALGFFRVSPIFPESLSDEKILGTESLFQFFKVFISYQLNMCMLPESDHESFV